LQEQIDRSLSARKDGEKASLRAQFKQMAEDAGFALSDIVGGGKVGRPRGSVMPKFVHPDDASLTWTGRGRMPKWLSEQVKAGVDPETFRVRD
jgi:DNA-binding protein H-NS